MSHADRLAELDRQFYVEQARADDVEARIATLEAELREAQRGAAGLYRAILAHLQGFFPPDSRDLEWDLLPRTIARKLTAFQQERDDARADATRLREALRDAAMSLRTIARLAGRRDELLTEMSQVRGYANSRATVAETALGAEAGTQSGTREAGAQKGESMSETPRRADTQRWTPAERAIYDAMQAVEAMAADVRLTDAVVLLDAARNSVADYIDGISKRRYVREQAGEAGVQAAAPGPVAEEPQVYCERCGLKVPERLATSGLGVRGGMAARCAACRPVLGEEARQEVITMRRAKLAAAAPENGTER